MMMAGDNKEEVSSSFRNGGLRCNPVKVRRGWVALLELKMGTMNGGLTPPFLPKWCRFISANAKRFIALTPRFTVILYIWMYFASFWDGAMSLWIGWREWKETRLRSWLTSATLWFLVVGALALGFLEMATPRRGHARMCRRALKA